MNFSNKLLSFALIAVFAIWCSSAVFAQALEPVGGPYTKDSNTVMLLHFDNNYNNQSDFTATAILRTKSPSKCFFFPASAKTELNQSVRLGNDAITDSSYIIVPDTAKLDLVGSWTIEGWMNVFTFGETSSDHRWVPRLCIKPGDEVFWQPNWWVELWGDYRRFQVGFFTGNAWPAVTSSINVMKPGEWVHLTFIRDNTRGFIVQMVHDAAGKLRFFGSKDYTPATDIPITNKQAVHMGWAGAEGIATPSSDSWLDGFLDEVRISNIVRNFAVPPIIKNVTELPNQPTTVGSYNISADIFPFNTGATITAAKLFYRVNEGTWDSLAMTKGTGNTYSATIPGQAVGKKVEYYISATDNNAQSAWMPLDAKAVPPTYYVFWIYQENTQTLKMMFDEGPGKKPVDSSAYKTKIITFNGPFYDTGKQGPYALWLKNDPAKVDSNWVEADSPFLSGESFCVDFWLKPDSNKHATRILNLPINPEDWNNNNYEISFRNYSNKGPVLTGRYFTRAGAGYLVVFQDTIAPVMGKWYHVIFERDKASKKTAFIVRDENDVQEFKLVKTDSTPVMGGAPLRIGRAHTVATNWWYIAPYRGLLDYLQVYNYPARGVTAVGDEVGLVPQEFELMQNYPNPFNPTTEIQFVLPKFQEASLIVFDILGREVKTIVNGQLHGGKHTYKWNGINNAGTPVATGVYFYQLKAGDLVQVRKMMLIR